ncbi:hypothetical protein [Kingella potus]|uniref:hypothetical protein n=1 Tax=Kingella potus TaxID=265175 RepID=UPI001C499327|nr:hypothetical protein [Kingella potus]
MKLIDYLSGGVSASELSKKVGVSPAFFMASQKRDTEKCRRNIARKSSRRRAGWFRRKDLRPDDWHEIWPELKEV